MRSVHNLLMSRICNQFLVLRELIDIHELGVSMFLMNYRHIISENDPAEMYRKKISSIKNRGTPFLKSH